MSSIGSAKGAARAAKGVKSCRFVPDSVLGIAAAALLGGLAAHLAWSQEAGSAVHSRMKDRERMVLTNRCRNWMANI
jgi:hypothetical protein